MEFTSLPFGIAIAPHVFTKIMKVPMSVLRRYGIRLVVYLDNILLMNQSLYGIKSDLETVYLLENLGFVINVNKSVLTPSHKTEFLGFTVNSEEMTSSLPHDKVLRIKQNCQKMLHSDTVSVRDLAILVGRLTAANQAVYPAPLHYRGLQMLKTQALHSGGHYDHTLVLDQTSRQELEWWIQKLESWNGKALLQPNPLIIIKSDASLLGWGATCQNERIGGPWLPNEAQNHINVLEFKAVFLALQSFSGLVLKKTVLIQTDNKVVMAYINKMGGTKSDQLVNIARQVWDWCIQRGITLTAEYIPTDLNVEADWESRHFSDYSSWKLNPSIFQSIMQIFGNCNVDLFADRTNYQLKRYFSWKSDPRASAIDALAQSWIGIVGYAFPPFCLVGPCLSKVREEKSQIVLVTPTWQSQPWYPLLLLMLIDNPVLLPMNRRALTSPQGVVHPLLENDTLSLAGWKISGDVTLQKGFQRKLETYSCMLGDPVQNPLTIVPGRSGIAGVANGKLIRFQHLWPLC